MKFILNNLFNYILVSVVLINWLNGTSMITNTATEIPVTDDTPHQEEEDILQCNEEILRNYGMLGNPEPTNANHKFCPTINQNCCSQADQDRSMEMWNDEIKPVIER